MPPCNNLSYSKFLNILNELRLYASLEVNDCIQVECDTTYPGRWGRGAALSHGLLSVHETVEQRVVGVRQLERGVRRNVF